MTPAETLVADLTKPIPIEIEQFLMQPLVITIISIILLIIAGICIAKVVGG